MKKNKDLELQWLEESNSLEDLFDKTAKKIEDTLSSPNYEHIKHNYSSDYKKINVINYNVESNFEYLGEKSTFKNSIKSIGAIFSLGGSYKLELEIKRYECLYNELYSPRLSVLKRKKRKIDKSLIEIGNTFIKLKESFDDVNSILTKNVESINSKFKSESNTIINEINSFNQGYSSAINTGFGGLVGGVSALGAWGLVSIIGSASTGTAISSLSGVAATNATLAWFGGGSLATGGAGMVGGMYVLSGIVAAPILYLSTKKKYKNANVVKNKTINLIDQIVILPNLIEEASNEDTKLELYKKNILCKIEFLLADLKEGVTDYNNSTSFWFSLFGGKHSENQLRAIYKIKNSSSEIITLLSNK